MVERVRGRAFSPVLHLDDASVRQTDVWALKFSTAGENCTTVLSEHVLSCLFCHHVAIFPNGYDGILDACHVHVPLRESHVVMGEYMDDRIPT